MATVPQRQRRCKCRTGNDRCGAGHADPAVQSAAFLRIDRTDPADSAACRRLGCRRSDCGLAVEIVSRAQDGNKRFDIRLDPPELGRIDVRLDVDQGRQSHLAPDRRALRHARPAAPRRAQLERALQHAGLNTDGGLQFSLRDQNFAGRDQSQGNSAKVSQLIIPEDEQAASEAARRGYGRLIGGGGVDPGPGPGPGQSLSDDERRDAAARQRMLLYVAATRARDELVVTYSGHKSELMP